TREVFGVRGAGPPGPDAFFGAAFSGGRSRPRTGCAGARIRRRLRLVAVDDVVLLADRHAVRIGDLVLHGDEDERAAAPLLALHVGDARRARDLFSDAQRALEVQSPARPHAPRQR